jgi:predicted NUDIX family phosphoesterase
MGKQQLNYKHMSNIIAVPVEVLNLKGREGFITGRNALVIREQIQKHFITRERELLETNPTYRQVITYCIVENFESEMLLLMQRKPKQEETRLHGKHYIGVGGHVEFKDNTAFDLECLRELQEETGIEPSEGVDFIGVVITSGSPVDDVHIGLVYHCRVSDFEIHTEEMDMHNHQWIKWNDIDIDTYKNMEMWSKIIFTNWYGKYSATLMDALLGK